MLGKLDKGASLRMTLLDRIYVRGAAGCLSKEEEEEEEAEDALATEYFVFIPW